MTVHVWTRNGEYVGQLSAAPGWQLDINALDEDHRDKIKAALLSPDRSEDLEIRSGTWRQSVEFPSEGWVALAAILFLPTAGYRVHVVMEAGP